MPELTTDIRYIKGIGEKRAEALGRLGIRTLGDLLCYFPRDYEDRTAVRPLAELLPAATAGARRSQTPFLSGRTARAPSRGGYCRSTG